jgi:hypothetical protein
MEPDLDQQRQQAHALLDLLPAEKLSVVRSLLEGVSEKDHAHQLIERLPDSQVATAVRFLEFMLLDPVARAVATAPLDDEPVTQQDRRRFHDGQTWFAERGGAGVPMEDVLAGFGLKPEDFPTDR